ncbi:MAG: tRNA lysidine(34) synthetase TilS [Bdellovibrionales bacterium]|nr:tRNA lysidine(34) synthetase TilS [Bdellovibrionales bacterium]
MPLEHNVLRGLRRYALTGAPLLVAVSGGQDSIILLYILKRLSPVLKAPVSVAHIHHGVGSARQVLYRNKAQKFVEKNARDLGLEFFTVKRKAKLPLGSEEELREYRYRELNKIREKIYKKTGVRPLLALGHHQDDQVETQMIRLIRGTGLYGLRGIEFFSKSEGRVRPLLNCSKKELVAYSKKMKLKWCEDPSNEMVDPLRNWLRHKWFQSLNKKVPGATASLARSLKLIVSEGLPSEARSKENKNGLDRRRFLELSRDEKAIHIAGYLRELKMTRYSQGQIEEICRRLDNRRVEYTFTILKHEWRVDARRILALKLE